MDVRSEIEETINRFAASIDNKDWSQLESVLAKAIAVDYEDLRGDPPHVTSARDYVVARREALQYLDTTHSISGLVIDVQGVRATVECSSEILRTRDGSVFNTQAKYQFGLQRIFHHGWVIDKITQTILRNDGDPSIHAGAKH